MFEGNGGVVFLVTYISITLGTIKVSYFLNILFIFLNIICIDDNICQLLQFIYENPLVHLEDNHCVHPQ